jgi:uncharacterized protein YjbI with pentapeptide repeats
MANDEHAEWLKHGHKEWNERRRLIHFTPDLSGINFEFVLYELGSKGNNKSFFSRFNFSDANLREANLEGLNFSRANFSNADLTRAILSNGNFKHARFDRANLTNVIAQNAIFVEARLNDARLIGMELSGANCWFPRRTEPVRRIISIEN